MLFSDLSDGTGDFAANHVSAGSLPLHPVFSLPVAGPLEGFN
jgi:hypothetical protein